MRVLLLAAGVSIFAVVVWLAGPRLVLEMLWRVGWSFPLAAGVYAGQVAVRAAALRHSVLGQPLRYADVLRIRLSGEAVEWLTFTGPFLAEPTKGVLLKAHGIPAAVAFAAVATEYLMYLVVSSAANAAAMGLLLWGGLLPAAARPAAIVLLAAATGFLAATAAAAITGIGLIVPILRASRVAIGARRAQSAAGAVAPVERVIVAFLHEHPRRLVEVVLLECAALALLMAEVRIVMAALGFVLTWPNVLILEGGAKSASAAFVPGQFGVSEALYALLAGAVGVPAATGLTLALVRRLRGLLVGLVGLGVTRAR